MVIINKVISEPWLLSINVGKSSVINVYVMYNKLITNQYTNLRLSRYTYKKIKYTFFMIYFVAIF